MFKNRPVDHIGLATDDAKRDQQFYQDVLGFHIKGKFPNNGGTVYFVENDHGTVYEIYNEENLIAKGKIDHIAYTSYDIEEDYAFAKEQGYDVCTDGIENIPTFWEHGIRYFKIKSPTGEEIEFCQKL